MGKLIYCMNVSLDGYVETVDRSLDWTMVDEELHTWFNDRARETDAFLHGRRVYEVMAAYWPTAESDPSATEYMLVHPVILGAGTPFFPPFDVPIRLRQTETRTFHSGVTYLGYSAV